MKYSRYLLLFAMLIIQSCSAAVVATPTPEQPSPVPPTPTPTLEQPSPAPPTATAKILEPTQTSTIGPPFGFKTFEDSVAGVSVFVPESWVVIEVDPGQLA
ncbi:hypothetical protein ACFLZW_07425 [Chloroflexota bacterium]